MRRYFGLLAFAAGNLIAFIASLVRRWPYMDQIPVHDLDVTTSVAVMWARSWFWEGALALRFATTYAPLSVETATLALRRPYESWPPGIVAPIYLTAVAIGQEPSVAMVNWINVVSHGLTSLFLSGAAYVLCRYNGWSRTSSGVIAAAVPFVALLQRGPAWFFSQIYTYDPHVLVFVSLFIFLECCYHYTSSERTQRWLTVAMLCLGLWGCLVDWLMYFVLAVWVAGRFVGERLGSVTPMRPLTWVVAIAIPFVSFALFLWWRLSLPGSLMETVGLRGMLLDLLFKITYRAGFQTDSPMPVPFLPHLWWMHKHYFSPLAALALLCSITVIPVLAIFVHGTRGSATQAPKAMFATLLIACLVTLPVYAQIVVFRQHSVIHPFSIAKVLMPLSFLPFVIVPLLTVPLLKVAAARRLISMPRAALLKRVIPSITLVTAVLVGVYSQEPYLIGQIDRGRMEVFETVRRNVGFHDVVFSPEAPLEARPFMAAAGISNKVIFFLEHFHWLDEFVRKVCPPFNVVIVFRNEPPGGAWQGHRPSSAWRDGGLTFFKYVDYPGPAEGCPKRAQ